MKNKTLSRTIIEGASDLSLAVSMLVAVVIGVALGVGLKTLFGYEWLLYLGIFWGVAAAVLNFYKAYKKLRREMNELQENPRYKMAQKQPDDDEDED